MGRMAGRNMPVNLAIAHVLDKMSKCCKQSKYMGLDVRKPVFGGLGTTKTQTSLICTV